MYDKPKDGVPIFKVIYSWQYKIQLTNHSRLVYQLCAAAGFTPAGCITNGVDSHNTYTCLIIYEGGGGEGGP